MVRDAGLGAFGAVPASSGNLERFPFASGSDPARIGRSSRALVGRPRPSCRRRTFENELTAGNQGLSIRCRWPPSRRFNAIINWSRRMASVVRSDRPSPVQWPHLSKPVLRSKSFCYLPSLFPCLLTNSANHCAPSTTKPSLDPFVTITKNTTAISD